MKKCYFGESVPPYIIMKRRTWNVVDTSLLLHLPLDHLHIERLVEAQRRPLHITASQNCGAIGFLRWSHLKI